MADWSTDNIPDLTGRLAVVTGANTGLGYQSTLNLVKHGMEVVMACRSASKGNKAVEDIQKAVPGAKVHFMALDLSDFDSIRAFADAFAKKFTSLHLLMDNAGIMFLPSREVTKQGFEMTFGVCHLGHFLLTKLLWPILKATSDSRAVILSSGYHKSGRMNWEDLQYEKAEYDKPKIYGQAKLANLLFMLELSRRSKDVVVTGAHPGFTMTDLQRYQDIDGGTNVEEGVLSQLRAATDPTVKSGNYFGPKEFLRGPPVVEIPDAHALSEEDAKKLWEISEELIGEKFEL